MNEPADLSPKPIVLKTDTGFGYFDYDDIILFRAEGHKVECLTTANEAPFRVYHSLTELEKKYDNRFLRKCNRSTIVNSRHFKNLETKAKKLHLNNDIVLNVSDGFINILRNSSKNNNYEKKYPASKPFLLRKLKIIINRIRFGYRKEIFKKTINGKKTIKVFSILIMILMTIFRCESPERFYRPDLPEKLCVIGIIDVDDTTLRHISFEKSYQSEYSEEVSDSLRDFSFSISSDTEELFTYHSDSTIKLLKDFKIPYNFQFIPEEKYYLNASEKDLPEIYAEVVAAPPPAKPELISVHVEDTKLSEPTGCINILDVRTAKIELKFKSNNDLHYALMVRCWGFSLSGLFAPHPGYMDFSVIESNTPGFLAAIKGLTIPHWTCHNISVYQPKDPAYAYLIEGNKIPGTECHLTLTIQYMDGYSLYDFIKTFGIVLISLPEELYQFEKSVYTFKTNEGDPFTEPIYINGNIRGGNGIFALCRSNELKITFAPWI